MRNMQEFSAIENKLDIIDKLKDSPLGIILGKGKFEPLYDNYDASIVDKDAFNKKDNISEGEDNKKETGEPIEIVKLSELTEEQKEKLRQIGMPESMIEKCKIGDDGVYYLTTINENLEGTVHPGTGVPYERKRIEINGIVVEGVFPKFDSVFSCELSPENLNGSDREQFQECMGKLKEAVDKDPELAKQFSEKQLEQIHDPKATTVSGYTWHHNEETGKMELVKSDVHGKTAHTGGKSIWGGGNENR